MSRAPVPGTLVRRARLPNRAPYLGLLATGLLALAAPRAASPQSEGNAPAVAADSLAAAADSTAAAADSIPHFEPVPDRWRDIPLPPYDKNVQGNWYDPYNQNVLKGDYPILGQNTFLVVTAQSETFGALAASPTPSGVSTAEPGSFDAFGQGDRFLFTETLKLSLEFYHGDAAFKPRDWELRFTPVFNANYVDLKENNNVNINVRKGTSRGDSHLGIQELSFEKHLFDVSRRYDFVSARIGIQRFGSDFRDLVFKDYNLGARLFGSAGGNRWQYNAAYFPLLEKDTNSELNTVFEDREQDVAVLNLYRQDTFALGYTAQLSVHMNRDEASEYVDHNGVPVRPAILGFAVPHEITAYYVGWAGDGHFGRWNVSHALYQVFGRDDFNPAAAREIDINAQLAFVELSFDRDWMRFKGSLLYASGDGDPADDTGTGWDGIVDEAFVAGGALSYWNSQAIRLGGVNLVNAKSPYPSLRPNKFEGQANFVNPGLFLAHLGYDADLTPKIRLAANVSYLSFADTEVLDAVLNQPGIGHAIGLDYGLGFQYRPFLNNNAIVTLGAAALTPFSGFNDIYDSPGTQAALSGSLTLTY